jgi:heme/copper-type cytochrome/quinol oxidase subunit 2
MTFQDPATSIMEGIVDLHHDIMFFIVLISTAVF